MKELFPLVAVDIALFTVMDRQLRVLLVRRRADTAPGEWALLGGQLKPNEDRSLEHTARRILSTNANADIPHLEQVTTVSGADRDPRGWSVSTLFCALLPRDKVRDLAGDPVGAIKWCDPRAPELCLALDHAHLLQAALAMLEAKISGGALPLQLLSERFTLTDIQRACEAVLDRPLDKGAFRRHLKNVQGLVPIEGEFLRGPQRPAQLYRRTADFRF